MCDVTQHHELTCSGNRARLSSCCYDSLVLDAIEHGSLVAVTYHQIAVEEAVAAGERFAVEFAVVLVQAVPSVRMTDFLELRKTSRR